MCGTGKRQPGSVFKPFVYTTALDNGYPVTEQLLNQPVVLNIQNMDGTWVKWKPQNYDGSTGGLTTLERFEKINEFDICSDGSARYSTCRPSKTNC